MDDKAVNDLGGTRSIVMDEGFIHDAHALLNAKYPIVTRAEKAENIAKGAIKLWTQHVELWADFEVVTGEVHSLARDYDNLLSLHVDLKINAERMMHLGFWSRLRFLFNPSHFWWIQDGREADQ